MTTTTSTTSTDKITAYHLFIAAPYSSNRALVPRVFLHEYRTTNKPNKPDVHQRCRLFDNNATEMLRQFIATTFDANADRRTPLRIYTRANKESSARLNNKIGPFFTAAIMRPESCSQGIQPAKTLPQMHKTAYSSVISSKLRNAGIAHVACPNERPQL